MSNPDTSPRFPMRVVTRRTGLSPDLLRAWERRYSVVTPGRSEGGQRVYSEADIERLRVLHELTQAGHSISTLARLSPDELLALAREARAADPAGAPPALEVTIAHTLKRCLVAIARLDSAALDDELRRTAILLGSAPFVDRVVSPLLREVGDRWHGGALTPAHEHLATAVVRRVLAWITDTSTPHNNAPRILIGTPAGELHELGALLAHSAAAEEGWEVIYLGADLPAEAIGAAARARDARFVALSAVYLSPPEALRAEVARVLAALGGKTPLLMGGAAADESQTELEKLGARVLPDLASLRAVLRDAYDRLLPSRIAS